MDLKKLTDKAKGLIEQRGGTDSLKQDADELKGIATGQGSLTDKAKAAVSAIKEPGADEVRAPAPEPAAEASPAEQGGGGGQRRKGGGGGGGQGRRKRDGDGGERGGDGDPAV